MAEQEIAKHTKKVVQLMGKSEHGWRHKLAEMGLEIVTIVFAVSLSIWLHSLGEHRHEQQQVRAFLLGVRHDIGSDLDMIKELNQAYHGYDANFDYLGKLDPRSAPDPQTFAAAYERADHNYYFNPLVSRYQGFKSSGKLGHIENEALLEKILALYERNTAAIKSSEAGWRNNQEIFRAYMENGMTGDGDIAERYRLITSPKGKRLLRKQITFPQLYDRYNDYAALGAEIIKEIEHEYPEAAQQKK
ncbi:hypothetical protein Jab_1c02200 [Janthinobacterium sp. HH01]|uniref:hypothetical protein n=1 Tax=Janthinobacterium sp. HH01 TaxID=1198452 RepID=UPI0002AE8720|nr:hypothetical protein [Janthinobacterium sp. HH01]ELX11636.1 hypothetical protein Jab_1c02200 [Janthinobacterium sp. HH01]